MTQSRAVLAVVTVLIGCAACGVVRAADTAISKVMGSIDIGADQHTGDVSTVNGSIHIGENAVVGAADTVNGAIRVAAAHVGGLIETVTGDIELGPNARVDGGVHVQKDTSWFHLWFWSDDTPRVVVGPGSVVGGTLSFERDVKLYVSDRATIGRVEGATAVRFSGERPPR